ncbi:hypothetical protein BT93_B3236 [Corymbia citriodora subsp. variegata]|nr:hypothetical protein BT93_B3236 [Corymbia citriodora subsp. variegata]
MAMDPLFFGYSACINVDGLPIDSHIFSHNSDQNPSPTNGFFLDDHILDLESSNSAFVSNKVDPVTNLPSKSVDLDNGNLIFPSTSMSLEGGSFGPSMSLSRGQSPEGDSLFPSGDSDSFDTVLKYEQPWLFANQVALQNAEKSLYDALGQQHLEHNLSGSSSASRSHDATNVTVSSSDSADANFNVDSILQFLANFSSSITNFDESLHGPLVKSFFTDGENDSEGRANKQTALYTKESELSDLFDKVLLFTDNGVGMCSGDESLGTGLRKDLQPQRNKRRSNRGSGRGKKQGSKNTVDLITLLILCAQAISTSDFRTANELLKQIRENSSPFGDASQRLAHYFADGLEARLAGNKIRTQVLYSTVVAKTTSASDVLKSYQLQFSTCPFSQFPFFFANYMILKFAEKATTLHINRFWRCIGFQWPILIQKLSSRPEGPCKLRITGIELPQAGLRPAERIEETGHRLKKYCERFDVPFEFNFIASRNWEFIKFTDLKIQSSETVAVNCLDRFKNLHDGTVEDTNPRDAVLNLVREIKPHIFVHTVRNGSYNAPFFATRFREALFHFSAGFELLDATLDRDNRERLVFEREFHGREIMNVIACEGSERIERPETYKQWQIRHMRAGFKALPLDQDFMKLFRGKIKAYHKDFLLDEDGNWMLQGWRGRTFYGSSCWVPT